MILEEMTRKGQNVSWLLLASSNKIFQEKDDSHNDWLVLWWDQLLHSLEEMTVRGQVIDKTEKTNSVAKGPVRFLSWSKNWILWLKSDDQIKDVIFLPKTTTL